MKSFKPHIEVICDAIFHIRQYQPESRSAFLEQTMVQDAILMRLQVIGENLASMRQIDEELFLALGDESWNEIIGLRNVISHGYVTIRFDRIWDFVVEDLPALADSIESAKMRLD